MGCDKSDHTEMKNPQEQKTAPTKPEISVETEAQHTMDLFRNASGGNETVNHAFEEIERERRQFGIGSDKEKAFTQRVHDKLVKENLLPEMSLKYAKENFRDLSDGQNITEDSFKRFRVATYKEMTPVEKAMNHYLMKNYDQLKLETTPKDGTCIGMEDLDSALRKAHDTRHDDANKASQNAYADAQAGELISLLTANNGTLLGKITDRGAGGITRESLENAENYDNVRPKWLNAAERRAVYNLEQQFDDISGGDGVISNLDLKYYGGSHNVNTSSLKR